MTDVVIRILNTKQDKHLTFCTQYTLRVLVGGCMAFLGETFETCLEQLGVHFSLDIFEATCCTVRTCCQRAYT